MDSKRATFFSGKDAAGDFPSPPRPKSRKPKYSRFTQQEIPACKPLLTPAWVVMAFVAVALVFIPIGLATLFASERVVEIVYRYDVDCIPENSRSDKLGYIQDSQANKTCVKALYVPKHMKAPIYVYYEIENFYQNHRRYAMSRSDKQLRSKTGEHDTGSCDPEGTTSNGTPIVPCGLIAWSLFNDTYRFSRSNSNLEVSKRNIAWKSDRVNKFGKDVYPKNFQSGSLTGGAKLNTSIPLREQEDLIVWMRTAALPTFRKLYGKIEVDLRSKEEITVIILNNYNTYSFNGKKKLVLSTTSWMGGKNDFIGISYIAVGSLCIFLAAVFIIAHVSKPRTLGDPMYLTWNRTGVRHCM